MKYIFKISFNIFFILIYIIQEHQSNEDAKRLLDDLFSDYNSVVRPVSSPTDKIILSIGLKLSQIADIDEKNQIMTTNVWLRHEWYDHKLNWIPEHYGNTTKINIPSTSIWLPDVVFADGDYQITTKTKATIHYDGKVVWEPPMIYKSYCAINIEYYPFDIQDCYMKFGTWTFDGDLIDLEHVSINNSVKEKNVAITKKGGISTKLYTVEMGIDMSDYYQSVEWDVLSIPAQKNIKYYDCCAEPYFDIYFNITLRRKTLFYTVNLIIPCVNISFLSVLVFYLPSDSGEKLTLGISILVALLVFYLLLIELIPPTSLVIPLLGKYLLFTLILVNLSILLTIFILNLHHRKPNTHKMPFWMKRVIIEILPKLLMIERPKKQVKDLMMTFDEKNTGKFQDAVVPLCIKSNINQNAIGLNASNIMLDNINEKYNQGLGDSDKLKKSVSFKSLENENYFSSDFNLNSQLVNTASNFNRYPESIVDALNGIDYINVQMRKEAEESKEIDDWKYASMVIDRLLLWIFTVACLMGTFGILLQAPSIYDERKALLKNPNKL